MVRFDGGRTPPPLVSWMSDVAPSMPAPPSLPVLVDLGGFSFTAGGICMPVSGADVADLVGTLRYPSPAPQVPQRTLS